MRKGLRIILPQPFQARTSHILLYRPVSSQPSDKTDSDAGKENRTRRRNHVSINISTELAIEVVKSAGGGTPSGPVPVVPNEFAARVGIFRFIDTLHVERIDNTLKHRTLRRLVPEYYGVFGAGGNRYVLRREIKAVPTII